MEEIEFSKTFYNGRHLSDTNDTDRHDGAQGEGSFEVSLNNSKEVNEILFFMKDKRSRNLLPWPRVPLLEKNYISTPIGELARLILLLVNQSGLVHCTLDSPLILPYRDSWPVEYYECSIQLRVLHGSIYYNVHLQLDYSIRKNIPGTKTHEISSYLIDKIVLQKSDSANVEDDPSFELLKITCFIDGLEVDL